MLKHPGGVLDGAQEIARRAVQIQYRPVFAVHFLNPSNTYKMDTLALRTALVNETKKFLLALEDGASISQLEDIRMNIRRMSAVLEKRERNNNIALKPPPYSPTPQPRSAK